MERVQLQAGYVLHHRLFRESSVIADVMTPDYGVLRLVARNARSAKSRSRPLLQVFRPLLLSWTGRGEMKTLTGIEEQGMPVSLHGLQLACGYYLNELLLRLLPFNEGNVLLFAQYSSALGKLAEAIKLDAEQDTVTGGSESSGASATEVTLREFELELLDNLGLAPDFACCVESAAVGSVGEATAPVTGQSYHYYPSLGIARSVDADNLIADAARGNASGPALVVTVDGECLQALGQKDFTDAACLPDMKRLMRTQLAMHLGDKPLKSREMIKLYARKKPPATTAASE